MNYLGSLIAKERLQRNWSQEGLCGGICSVSYLSKIESDRAEASEEILSLLFSRLGIEYSGEIEGEAETLTNACFEALFSGSHTELCELISREKTQKLRACSRAIELELLLRFATGEREGLEKELEKYMGSRALGLQRILQGREEEALLLLNNAYACYEAGAAAYSRGDYSRAKELLATAYDRAAEDGSVRLMMLCKLFLSACCANRRDVEGMERHNKAARRLAAALGDTEAIEQMEYNAAATAIECGRYEEAYSYFSRLSRHDMMSLHKLAIACEMTGRGEEALAALRRSETMESDYPPDELARLMCRVVRYRVENNNYVNCQEYGQMLLELFERCRQELSMGYTLFHMPWVLEWYKANRQYKKALELLEEFSQN